MRRAVLTALPKYGEQASMGRFRCQYYRITEILLAVFAAILRAANTEILLAAFAEIPLY
jgi:hypothetical protein